MMLKDFPKAAKRLFCLLRADRLAKVSIHS